MALRPRPPGREYRGYTRVAVRKWIKDPAERMIVPEHILNMSESEYNRAFKVSVAHHNAAKKEIKRPSQLDSGFFEPEIYTVRSKYPRKYLERQSSMMEPELGVKRSSKSSSSSSSSSKIQKLSAGGIKTEERV